MVVSENSINTGGTRHFTPKKPGRRYNEHGMNGSSPYKAMEMTFAKGLPRENSGMRQYDLITGGTCIEAFRDVVNVRKTVQN
jgi:hypothetical protein